MALLLDSTNLEQDLDRNTLSVVGLPPGSYRLSIDDAPVGLYTDAEFARGVDISSGPDFDQSANVLALVREHTGDHFAAWRPKTGETMTAEQLGALEDAAVRRERAAAVPVAHRYRLERVDPGG
jgi:hypothetical protein